LFKTSGVQIVRLATFVLMGPERKLLRSPKEVW
jgi:hypothetical protein